MYLVVLGELANRTAGRFDRVCRGDHATNRRRKVKDRDDVGLLGTPLL